MQRFPYGRTFILGFGFFGISIIWPLFNSLIPPMLEDLGLSAVVVGFILTWDNPAAALKLALRTPSGLMLHPGNASSFGGSVKVKTAPAYTLMTVKLPISDS